MFRCTEKFVAGSMFPLANLNAFRHFDDGVDFSATTEVKEAWMVFLNDFCPLVSYEWKEYLKNVVNKDSATFFGNLTVSDEAFAEWTIVCKYDESFAEAEKIKTMGMDNWSLQRKKRKRGPHDSRKKMDDYARIYRNILAHRQNRVANTIWQQLFFEMYLNNTNSLSDVEDHISSDNQIPHKGFFSLPALDGELDGFDDPPVIAFSV
jgi:hypothetical protein